MKPNIFLTSALAAALVALHSCNTNEPYEVLLSEDRDGYVCNLIEYEVEEGEMTKAYLLIPSEAKDKKLPAVLMLHDHGARFDIGKEKLVRPISADGCGSPEYVVKSSRQWIDKNFDGVYFADSLAGLGYVVLVNDALYWGERSTDDAQLWSKLNYGSENDLPEKYRNLEKKERKDSIKALKTRVYEGQRIQYAQLQKEGRIWAEKILEDDAASARLLAQMDFVDAERIGAFGFSMGAHRCWLLAAFCPEIKCGAALSWMTTFAAHRYDNASDLSMRIQPMRDTMEFSGIAKHLYPKPMLFLSGETDHLFPREEVAKAFSEMEEIYSQKAADDKKNGPGHQLETLFFPDGHHCGKAVQSTIVKWLDKQL